MAKKPADPYAVKLKPEQRQTLARQLCEDIQDGLNARASQEVEVDYWWQLYEQARTRQGKNAPWPDAADLTSYLACEKVDAIHARGMRTIWVEPVWTVEGWGQAAQKAAVVEEFHQWKTEEERLQTVIDRWLLTALVEPRGLLEVYEDTTMRVTRKNMRAVQETLLDELSGIPMPVFDEKGEPVPQRDEDGTLIEATDPTLPAIELVVDDPQPVRTGPNYRILPYRDSLILPGHARERSEIREYGKRIWMRFPDIQAKAKAGVYDQEEVDKLTRTHEREGDPGLSRSNMAVAPAEGDRAEKELWEVLALLDLDGRGERWYLATVHLGQQLLLRLQHDDLERSRFIPVVLFPRPDRATEGYSLVGHKLITIIEEHTAWRNMVADRAAMQVQAPVKRMHNALWEPLEQPWGPKAVIDVRDMREVEPVVVPDLTAPAFEHIQMQERAAERVAGVTDVSAGVQPQEQRTLGEVQLVTNAAEIRMDLIIRRFQEAMEDLFQVRHAIWKRVLAEQPEGMDIPQSMSVGLEARGMGGMLDGNKVTADMLEGTYRGKPRGSVESSDPQKQRGDFVQALQALPMFLQAFPMAAMQFQTPDAARAMLQQFVRLFRLPNPQAFVGQPTMGVVPGLGASLPGSLLPPGMGVPAPQSPMMPQGMPMGGPMGMPMGPMMGQPEGSSGMVAPV